MTTGGLEERHGRRRISPLVGHHRAIRSWRKRPRTPTRRPLLQEIVKSFTQPGQGKRHQPQRHTHPFGDEPVCSTLEKINQKTKLRSLFLALTIPLSSTLTNLWRREFRTWRRQAHIAQKEPRQTRMRAHLNQSRSSSTSSSWSANLLSSRRMLVWSRE